MRNLLLLTTVLLSSVASAQVSVSLRLSTTGQDTVLFGKQDCGDRSFTVTWTRVGNACEALDLWLTQAGKDCGDVAATGDVPLDEVSLVLFQAQTTGTFQFNVNELPYPTPDGGGGCTELSDELTFRVCGSTKGFASLYDTTTCATTVTKATPLKVIFDGEPPAAPTIESASGLDQAVVANISEPTGATRVELVVLRDGATVGRESQSVGKGSVRVEGLENDVTYQLVAYALDEADNRSAESETREATPVKTNGFLEEYKNAGGAETGGCGAAGGGVAGGAVLAVLGFWLSSRRNRS